MWGQAKLGGPTPDGVAKVWVARLASFESWMKGALETRAPLREPGLNYLKEIGVVDPIRTGSCDCGHEWSRKQLDI